MGTSYAKRALRLHVTPDYESGRPRSHTTDPFVRYPVYWQPRQMQNETYPAGFPFADGPPGPLSGDSPFQGLHRLLKLPKVVVVCNGCLPDFEWGSPVRADGTNACITFPDSPGPDVAMNHFLGLGEALYEVLKPLGIMVYQVNDRATLGNFKDWVYQLMPNVTPETQFLGGDAYWIALQNQSLYVLEQFYCDVFYREFTGPDSCVDYTDHAGPLGHIAPDAFIDVAHDHHELSPMRHWAALAGKFRNWHGLVCGVAWEGDDASRVFGGGAGPGNDLLDEDGNLIPQSIQPPGAPAPFLGYVQRRIDLDNAELFRSLQDDVNRMNAIAPDSPGDASWEYALMDRNQPYGDFISIVRGWFGI